MHFTLSPRALNNDLYNENKYVFKFFLNDRWKLMTEVHMANYSMSLDHKNQNQLYPFLNQP